MGNLPDWAAFSLVVAAVVVPGTLLGILGYCVTIRRQRRRFDLEDSTFARPGADFLVDKPQKKRQHKTRLPFNISLSGVTERLEDAEIDQLLRNDHGAVRRLRQAGVWLAAAESEQAEALCLEALSAARSGFGAGKHWLEALILADLALFAHHKNDTEEADRLFAKSEAIAAGWLGKYPWLHRLCSARRRIRSTPTK